MSDRSLDDQAIPTEAAEAKRRRSPFETAPSPRVVGIGTAGALVAAVALGLMLAPRPKSTAGAAVHEPPMVTPVRAVEASGFAAAREPYQPPNADEVRRAKADVETAFRQQGVSGLARASMTCFQDLAVRPSYGRMDYCLAFDLFGESISQSLTPGDSPSRISWFGAAGARQHNVAQAVMGAEGDAEARLLDLRRMADAAAGKKLQWAATAPLPTLTRAVATAPTPAEAAEEDAPAETETSAAVQPYTPAPAPAPQPSTLAGQVAAAQRPAVAAPPLALPSARPAAPAVTPAAVELPAAEPQ